MSIEQPLILIIGAADTGRAPIAAALLCRLLQHRCLSWAVASAGVVGHDEEPAQPEARDAITILSLDISQHRARSLSDDLVASARILLAIDSGIARVLRARHPQASIVSLGEIAGRQRDIPDPFRMQVGAWLNYAHEIESLLSAGIDRLIALVEQIPAAPLVEEVLPTSPSVTQPELPEAGLRYATIERCLRLLDLLAEMPDVIDWPGARRQIEADLHAMGTPLGPTDLSRPYVAVIQAMLGLCPQSPTPAQIARLYESLSALGKPISAESLSALSVSLVGYATL